jgi:hypothetical protein
MGFIGTPPVPPAPLTRNEPFMDTPFDRWWTPSPRVVHRSVNPVHRGAACSGRPALSRTETVYPRGRNHSGHLSRTVFEVIIRLFVKFPCFDSVNKSSPQVVTQGRMLRPAC